MTAVVRETGSGKTTLIRLLLDFQNPTRSPVLYDGRPIAGQRGSELATFRRRRCKRSSRIRFMSSIPSITSIIPWSRP